MKDTIQAVEYHSYLQLDKILNAQSPESTKLGNTIHDETLFIIVHQVYELWFKQILHEIDDVRQTLSKDVLTDTSIYNVVSRLQRVIKIQHLMINQIKILETMTPMDFLEFRDFLGASSGLQSFQFRLFEIKLGVHYEKTTPFISRLNQSQQEIINQTLSEFSLLKLVEKWLERIPFLSIKDFSFWNNYKLAINNMLQEERGKIFQNAMLTEDEKQVRLQQLVQNESHFTALFDDDLYNKLLENGERHMSRLATSAALLIYIYRDQPVFQLPYMLLSCLVEIDELLTSWRHAHILMVQRMIGHRMGTGGTSGQNYLMHAMLSRKIFGDLTNLATYLVRGSNLPPLTDIIKQQLGFHYTRE